MGTEADMVDDANLTTLDTVIDPSDPDKHKVRYDQIKLNWHRIRKAAVLLRQREREYARLMTQEMGKTFDEGLAEVEKCAFHCDWFADHAPEYLANEPVDFDGEEAFVTFNPIGVVLAVMPWNFPFWQVFRFAAPALMAGNGALLKHASNVPG